MVDNIVMYKKGSELKDLLIGELGLMIKRDVVRVNRDGKDVDDMRLVLLYVDMWKAFNRNVLYISNVFIGLDRKGLNDGMMGLWDSATMLLGKYVHEGNVYDRFLDGIVLFVEEERDGKVIDLSMIISVLQMIKKIDLYPIFEEKLLSRTLEYYKSEFSTLIETSIPEYLVKVENRLEEEKNRGKQYLASTSEKIIDIIEKIGIKDEVDMILYMGLNQMLDNNEIVNLTRMYNLFSRVSCLEELKKDWQTHLKKTGEEIMDYPEAQIIDTILEHKKKTDDLLEKAFNNDADFLYARKISFETFVNSKGNQCAKLLADHIHNTLTKGKKTFELDTKIDTYLEIFRFLADKDIFEAFYRLDLSKRLLFTSYSESLEKNTINKLKIECGHEFVSKLVGMFKDLDVSNDLISSYKTELSASIDVKVNILTKIYWPTYLDTTSTLPTELAECKDNFEKFYADRFHKRVLIWQYPLSQCTVRANLDKRKDVTLSLLQTSIVMLFNDADVLTVKEIIAHTKLDTKQCVKLLFSLACGKVKLLRKEPNTRNIRPTDKISVVKGIKSKSKRLRFNHLQLLESKEEVSGTMQSVEESRKLELRATIVRVLKSRNVLEHKNLLTEIFRIMKPKFVKREIERLINEGFLERDAENTSLYHYKA